MKVEIWDIVDKGKVKKRDGLKMDTEDVVRGVYIYDVKLYLFFKQSFFIILRSSFITQKIVKWEFMGIYYG